MQQPTEYEKRLKSLETEMDRLRSLYEQYFRGIEKAAPTVLQKKLERELREMRKIRIRNTALRFRLQMLVQRYTTYLTYWQRIMRLLEFGQVKRSAGGLVPCKPVGLPGGPGTPASLDIPEPPRAARPAFAGPAGEELLDIDIEIDL